MEPPVQKNLTVLADMSKAFSPSRPPLCLHGHNEQKSNLFLMCIQTKFFETRNRKFPLTKNSYIFFSEQKFCPPQADMSANEKKFDGPPNCRRIITISYCSTPPARSELRSVFSTPREGEGISSYIEHKTTLPPCQD